MHFRFLTLFPNLISPYFKESILKRAQEKKLINVEIINLRNYADNKHLKVDDTQIGGGAGQVINFNVLEDALKNLVNKSHIVFLTPCAKAFNQFDAKRLAKKSDITFICGRYEGFDERVIELYANEVFSIGDFILTGGELSALCLCDSISRQIPGVLGNPQSLQEESFESNLLEAPVFSKAKIKAKKNEFFSPPLEYSQGNHSIISDLKHNLSVLKTKYFRPDLFLLWKSQNKGK
ncbi:MULTISPECIES: tRNA (guanosine(37)-N1)-methyltransferase TrmD [unclassified Helicobacter]|uniref:tRNA (guanosine(37)-N1)-methyltransferase TrmD n=1 Tax=unclassified Helicobacter TaxID=2593540 RepID=UPI000CF12558|nr:MULTISPECIES: tRNA (guanosine(37)-N1)-methyltransferase TrmD [unclassified Helicobacter]